MQQNQMGFGFVPRASFESRRADQSRAVEQREREVPIRMIEGSIDGAIVASGCLEMCSGRAATWSRCMRRCSSVLALLPCDAHNGCSGRCCPRSTSYRPVLSCPVLLRSPFTSFARAVILSPVFINCATLPIALLHLRFQMCCPSIYFNMRIGTYYYSVFRPSALISLIQNEEYHEI